MASTVYHTLHLTSELSGFVTLTDFSGSGPRTDLYSGIASRPLVRAARYSAPLSRSRMSSTLPPLRLILIAIDSVLNLLREIAVEDIGLAHLGV